MTGFFIMEKEKSISPQVIHNLDDLRKEFYSLIRRMFL